MKRILIVEDNKEIADMLRQSLCLENYQVDILYDGLNCVDFIKENNVDLILLDIMLPYKSGDQILEDIRLFSNIPIIVISAKDMVINKIDLLTLGADDYITKPFDLGEVNARVASLLRRTSIQEKHFNIYTYKDIILDSDLKEVKVDGIKLDLTHKEYMILELLMVYKGKLFSKGNIYEIIWKEDYLNDDNAVKTHMSHLRHKLKEINPDNQYIETLWGIGYRLYPD